MKSETMEEHRKRSPIKVSCGVITLSDSKYSDKKDGELTDISGKVIMEKINEKYEINSYKIIPDEKSQLLDTVDEMVKKDIDIIFTTGGTGIGSKDIAIETLEPLFEKKLPGFGEIFRGKTYEELGSGAILSRSTAGVYKKTIIFSMPGSPNAVKLGISIIINELAHLKKHLKE